MSEPVLIYPTDPVDDAGHNWAYRNTQQRGGCLTRGRPEPDCWLCRRGVCVQRCFYFLDSCELVVHGTYEA